MLNLGWISAWKAARLGGTLIVRPNVMWRFHFDKQFLVWRAGTQEATSMWNAQPFKRGNGGAVSRNGVSVLEGIGSKKVWASYMQFWAMAPPTLTHSLPWGILKVLRYPLLRLLDAIDTWRKTSNRQNRNYFRGIEQHAKRETDISWVVPFFFLPDVRTTCH